MRQNFELFCDKILWFSFFHKITLIFFRQNTLSFLLTFWTDGRLLLAFLLLRGFMFVSCSWSRVRGLMFVSCRRRAAAFRPQPWTSEAAHVCAAASSRNGSSPHPVTSPLPMRTSCILHGWRHTKTGIECVALSLAFCFTSVSSTSAGLEIKVSDFLILSEVGGVSPRHPKKKKN